MPYSRSVKTLLVDCSEPSPGSTKTSPPSWAALSLPVPLSADAEGSLRIKPYRDDNAAAHGGEEWWSAV